MARKTPAGRAAAPPKASAEGKGSGGKRAPVRLEYRGGAKAAPLPLATGSTAPGAAANPSAANPSAANPSAANPSADSPSGDSPSIEKAIGAKVRALRKRHDMTVTELSAQAGLSAGMLSKVENGAISPSLSTLQSLAQALNVPLTDFFADFEQRREATHVKAGQGIVLERRGTKAGHQYQLLGHPFPAAFACEPYLITLTRKAEAYASFRHEGMEFIYVLEGEVGYRHGNEIYRLGPGDSLFFSATAAHGPEELLKLPLRFLSVIVFEREK